MRFKIFIIFFLIVSLLNSKDIDIAKAKDKIVGEIELEFDRDFRVWGVKLYKDRLLIRFANNNLLFNAGSSELRTPFKIILIDFFPRFLKIVKKNKKYIDKVLILGHTSSENSRGRTKQEKFMRNLILSQERADEIYYFIKHIEDKRVRQNINFIKKNFEPIGYSSKYLIVENGRENKIKSRRIEFLIKLKESDFNLYKKNRKRSNNKGVKFKRKKVVFKAIKEIILEDDIKKSKTNKEDKKIKRIKNKHINKKKRKQKIKKVIIKEKDDKKYKIKIIKKIKKDIIKKTKPKTSKLKTNNIDSKKNHKKLLIVVKKDIKSEKSKKIEKLNLGILIKYILKRSEDIQAQYKLLKSLKKDIEAEKSKYYPTLTLNARYDDYINTTSTKTGTKYNDITIKYNIFKGLRDYYAVKIKYLNYKVKSYEKDKVELKIILSALKAILNYKKYQELINLSEDNLKDAMYIYNRERVKYENGMISLKDFAKVRSKIAQKKLDLLELKRQQNDYYSEILKYANVSIKNLNELDLNNINSLYFRNEKIAIRAMHINSPVFKIQKGNVELYKTKYKAKKIFIYPTIDLIAQKTHNIDEFNDGSSVVTDDTKVTLNFSLPLFSGGKDYYTKKKAYYEFKQQIELDKSKVSELDYQMRTDFNALRLYKKKIEVLNDFIKAKEDAYVVANYDYKFGKIDSFGLMGIMDDLFNAKKQLVENKYQILNFKYKLLHDIGILKDKFFIEGK